MSDLCFTGSIHAVSGHRFLRSAREMCDERSGRSNLSPVITFPPIFSFHSCVLWGRTTDTGPIRGHSCKPTRGIRQWYDAGVRLHGSEDVPLQRGKFAPGFCIKVHCYSQATASPKENWGVRTDLGRLDREVLKLWTTNVSSTTSTYAQYQALSAGDTTNNCRQN